MRKTLVEQVSEPSSGQVFRVSISPQDCGDGSQADRLANQLEDMGLSPIVQVGEMRMVWRTIRRDVRH